MWAAAAFALVGGALLVLSPGGISDAQPNRSCSGDYILTTGTPAFRTTANRLFANTDFAGWVTQRTYELNGDSVPAGGYDVEAVSYDGYEGREDDTQTNEVWFAEFYDAGGNLMGSTNVTQDVPDMVSEAFWSGGVGSLALDAEATRIVVRHGFITNLSPNSHEPICLGLTSTNQLPPPVTETVPPTTEPVPTVDPTVVTRPPDATPPTQPPGSSPPPVLTEPPTEVLGAVQETPAAEAVAAQPDFTG